MVKSLALINKDIADAYRLHSLTTPPEAIQLTALDKAMGEIWQKQIPPDQKLELYFQKLRQFMNIANALKVQPVPTDLKPPPMAPVSTEEEIIKEDPSTRKKITPIRKLKTEQITPSSKKRKLESMSSTGEYESMQTPGEFEESVPALTSTPKTSKEMLELPEIKPLINVLKNYNKFKINKAGDVTIGKITTKPGNLTPVLNFLLDKTSQKAHIASLPTTQQKLIKEIQKNAVMNPDFTKIAEKIPGLWNILGTKGAKRTLRYESKSSSPTKIGSGGKVHLRRWMKHLAY